MDVNIFKEVERILADIERRLESINRVANSFNGFRTSLSAISSTNKALKEQSDVLNAARKAQEALKISKGRTATQVEALQRKETTRKVLTKNQTIALKRQQAALTAKTVALKKQNAVVKKATVFNKALNFVKKANPIMAIISAVMMAISALRMLNNVVGGAISAFRSWTSSSYRYARDFENSINQLSDEFSRCVDDIAADLERMGLEFENQADLKIWENVERSVQEFADTFGDCADQIRGEIADLVNYYGDHERAIATWGDQRAILDDVAETWGMTIGEIRDELDVMGKLFTDEGALDMWSDIAENAQDFATIFSECADTIRGELLELTAYSGDSEEAFARWRASQMEMLDGVGDAWGLSGDTVLKQMQDMGVNADQWAKQMGQAWDSFNADVQSNVDGIVNGFNRIAPEVGRSSVELREVMEDNIATTHAWRENLAGIAEDVPEEMLAWLEGKGPEFNDVIYDMLNVEGELDRWVDIFGEKSALATEQALENIECDNVLNAIESRLSAEAQLVEDSNEYKDAYGEMFREGHEYALDIVEEGAQEIGETGINTLADTIEEGEEVLTPVIENILEGIQDRFDTLEDSFHDAGVNAMSGLLRGMESKQSDAINLATNIGDAISSTLQSALNFTAGISSAVNAALPSNLHQNFSLATSPSDAIYQSTMMDKVDKLIDAVEAGKNIIMDTGELVGATYHGYDVAAGTAISYNKRWGR